MDRCCQDRSKLQITIETCCSWDANNWALELVLGLLLGSQIVLATAFMTSHELPFTIRPVVFNTCELEAIIGQSGDSEVTT